MPDLKQRARAAVERCPHCGNDTGLELSQVLYYRCRICGGPRVPIVGEPVQRSGRELQHLRAARRAQRAQLLYRVLWVTSGVVGGFSFLIMLLTLLLFSGLTTAWASVLLVPTMPLLLAFWARHRCRRSREALRTSLEDAWASTAHELLTTQGQELTSEQLAELMLTDETHADQLLARLNVEDEVRSRVTDAGQVAYSVRAPRRLRLPTDPRPSGTVEMDELEREEVVQQTRGKQE